MGRRHRQPVTAVALSEDDSKGFLASKDGLIVHWDIEIGASDIYLVRLILLHRFPFIHEFLEQDKILKFISKNKLIFSEKIQSEKVTWATALKLMEPNLNAIASLTIAYL